MSVFQRPGSPYWQYSFDVGGNRFSGSTKCRNEDEARRFEEKRKEEARKIVAEIRASGTGPLTLKAACDRWWREHGSTLADVGIKSALDRLVEIIGAKTYLHDITDDVVSRMVQERRKDGRRDRTIKAPDGKETILHRQITPGAVNRTIDLLRRVMNRARDNWNAAIIKPPKWKNHRLKEKKGHVREISRDEEKKLDEFEDIDFAELRRFAIVTGLRKRSFFLAWSQVDFDLGIIRVITKGNTPRIIPMTREIYAMLWRRRDHHKTHVWTFQAQRTFAIPKAKGGGERIKGQRYPITYWGFTTHCRRQWTKAGVKARIHDLRHTTGMRTLRRTKNLRVVQELLGHTEIKTTATFYTAALVEDLRNAMEETAPQDNAAPQLVEKKESKE